jgi:hypothetical protein
VEARVVSDRHHGAVESFQGAPRTAWYGLGRTRTDAAMPRDRWTEPQLRRGMNCPLSPYLIAGNLNRKVSRAVYPAKSHSCLEKGEVWNGFARRNADRFRLTLRNGHC